jgi:hypothetical protein
MRSFVTAGLFVALVISSSPAFAQEQALLAPTVVRELSLSLHVAAAARVDDAVIIPIQSTTSGRRVLTMLNVGVAGLQVYDVYSTSKVLKMGGVEANPLMKGVTRNPIAFVAMKTGIAAATIYGAERLWKQNHRTAAIALVAISNAMMGFVAVNNTAVLRGMR